MGEKFAATIRRDYFPYFTQSKSTTITITGLELYDQGPSKPPTMLNPTTNDLNNLSGQGQLTFTYEGAEDLTSAAGAQVYLIVHYSLE